MRIPWLYGGVAGFGRRCLLLPLVQIKRGVDLGLTRQQFSQSLLVLEWFAELLAIVGQHLL